MMRPTRQAVVLLLVALLATQAFAANTEPTLALMRATAVRAASGRITVTMEASFSFADAVQLALPVDIVVSQGTRVAHFSLDGQVSLSENGGPILVIDPPGVLSVSERTIVLVLPASFGPGEATARITADYGRKGVASNELRFSI